MDAINKLYHGTLTPVHTLADPFLDPELARGGDYGDPTTSTGDVIPHVFLTTSLLNGRMFGAKLPEQMISDAGNNFSYVVYTRRPELYVPGYVYEIDPQKYSLQQRLVHGKPTGHWISFEKVDVSHGPLEIVGGVMSLMRDEKIHAFYVTDKRQAEQFGKAWSSRHLTNGATRFVLQAYKHKILMHLNDEVGVNPALPSVRNDPHIERALAQFKL